MKDIEISVLVNGRKYSTENGSKVFLADETNFSLELFSLRTRICVAYFRLNGQLLKGGLVLYPGKKSILSDFISIDRKLVFHTYTVEKSAKVEKAILNNGLVEITFYNEIEFSKPKIIDYENLPSFKLIREIETGIISIGEKSDSKYTYVDITIEESAFLKYSFRLLPTALELNRCPKCSTKVTEDDNFCRMCGLQLQIVEA